MNMTDILAICGALSSIFLAYLAFKDVNLNRQRLSVIASLNSNPEVGDELAITNPTNRPILIKFFRIIDLSGNSIIDINHFSSNLPTEPFVLQPFLPYLLSFRDTNFFNFSRIKKDKEIFLEITFVEKFGLPFLKKTSIKYPI